jgi:undecaprenyl-diphosphatase
MVETLQKIDTSLFLLFNRDLTNPFFDVIMPFITRGTSWILPLLLMGYLFWKKEGKVALALMAFSLILVGLSDLFSVRVLKQLVERTRPCDPANLVEGGRFLVGHLRSLSFPSSHAFNSAAFAAYFTYFIPKRKYLFLAITLLIGYTRVYVGVHYPFDVLGGWLIGAGMGISYAWLIGLIIRPRK